MADTFLDFLADETIRQGLTWLGGGQMVVAGGAWTVVKHV
ncbi:hypothetical protein SAMN05880593_11627 [Rhizobium sp. RU36D]|nr:hypothetical protein SAMN05880593_11627 [Rhizobium sp. RU36D]